MKALAHVLSRQMPAAVAEFREILKLDPKEFSVMSTLAWFEATSPDDGVPQWQGGS